MAAALEVLTSSDTVSPADLQRVRTLLRDATSLLTPSLHHPLPRSPAVLRSPRRTMHPTAVMLEYVKLPLLQLAASPGSHVGPGAVSQRSR